jgi:hypothetical protein
LKIKEKDTFQISTLNRDPFLNKSFSKTELKAIVFMQTPVVSSIPKVTPKPIITISFPVINYLGYIKSKDKNYEMALLKVNGKFLKLKINEIKENLKVISITKDSVKVKYDNQEKSFSLKK